MHEPFISVRVLSRRHLNSHCTPPTPPLEVQPQGRQRNIATTTTAAMHSVTGRPRSRPRRCRHPGSRHPARPPSISPRHCHCSRAGAWAGALRTRIRTISGPGFTREPCATPFSQFSMGATAVPQADEEPPRLLLAEAARLLLKTWRPVRRMDVRLFRQRPYRASKSTCGGWTRNFHGHRRRVGCGSRAPSRGGGVSSTFNGVATISRCCPSAASKSPAAGRLLGLPDRGPMRHRLQGLRSSRGRRSRRGAECAGRAALGGGQGGHGREGEGGDEDARPTLATRSGWRRRGRTRRAGHAVRPGLGLPSLRRRASPPGAPRRGPGRARSRAAAAGAERY